MTKRDPIPTRFPSVLKHAQALIKSGNAAQALPVLARTLETAQAFDPAHATYLQTLLGLGMRKEALAALELSLRLPTPTSDACDALAYLARQLDQHQQANALYRKAVELTPTSARYWYNLAASERNLGDLAHAASACGKALELDPDNLPALLLRSEIQPASPGRNHAPELISRLNSARTDQARMFIAYALGKELHDLKHYGDAFHAFMVGATARRRGLRYDVAEDEQKMARIQGSFAQRGATANVQSAIDRHIFIIGLPRSGTTLTERILSRAPGIRSNGETNNFSTALLGSLPKTTDIFAASSRVDSEEVARAYDQLAAFDGYAGRIIEKLPFNYLYVGAIARAFPQSPIVWVRRDPLDNCFAMFRTLFGAAYPFSYDFEELARYFAAFERLMKHWTALWPERLVTVDYEELVTRPKAVASTLAERCGVPWSDQLLDIATNPAPSMTASASQVRQPIHARSTGIWRRYATSLGPLEALLQRHRSSA